MIGGGVAIGTPSVWATMGETPPFEGVENLAETRKNSLTTFSLIETSSLGKIGSD